VSQASDGAGAAFHVNVSGTATEDRGDSGRGHPREDGGRRSPATNQAGCAAQKGKAHRRKLAIGEAAGRNVTMRRKPRAQKVLRHQTAK